MPRYFPPQALSCNPANPCRCSKKTKGLIREGKVDPDRMTFTPQALQTLQSVVPAANRQLDQLIEGKYLQFSLEQPYEQSNQLDSLVGTLLLDPEVKDLFRLN